MPRSGSIRSLLPSQLYLDHSHCPVLAPGRADLHSLAALPSTRTIETRLLPSFDSCAPAHLKLGRVPASSPLPSRLCLLCRFSQKLHSTSRFCPSMSLAPPQLHSHRYPPRLCLLCRF